jgi:hypothetical protein
VNLDPVGAEDAFGERGDESLRHPWSNRSVALFILSIMGVMAAIGLAFAWYTTESRRHRDHLGDSAGPTLAPNIATAPAQLAALGYLPPGMDVIAGVHIAELMAQPKNQAILLRLFDDRRLHELCGLRLGDLDHVAFGLKMEENDLLHLLLIIRTLRPYSAGKVGRALHVSGRIKDSDKIAYYISPEQFPLGAVLWFADERTLVLSLSPNDLGDAPAQPNPRVDRFSAYIHECLHRRMGEGTQAWVAGTASHWESLFELIGFLGLMPFDKSVLSPVRAFWGRLDCTRNWIDGQLEIQCADAASAQKLDEQLFRRVLDPQHLQEIAEKWPQAAALLKDLAKSPKPTQAEDGLRVELRASHQSVLEALAQPAP